jgi:chemotaxis protein MotB
MARKRSAPAPANHDRWLISYADFITLLFAFFVVMFASSQSERNNAQEISEAIKNALQGKHTPQVTSVLGGTVDDKGQGNRQRQGPGGVEDLLPSFDLLSKELKQEIDEGKIQVSMQSRGLVVSFTQAALFPSGNDEVASAAYAGLEKVAGAIGKVRNSVRLEGHTDSRPIATARFKSNWELSAARSIALLEILSQRFGLPRGRLSVAGYADTAPVASNGDEEGRARNRRVDIVLLNQQAQLAEPVKAEQK